MSAYLVRRLDTRVFEVTKWSERIRPDAVYRIEQTSVRNFVCDCPTRGTKKCKHVVLVKKFIAAGKDWDPLKMVEM